MLSHLRAHKTTGSSNKIQLFVHIPQTFKRIFIDLGDRIDILASGLLLTKFGLKGVFLFMAGLAIIDLILSSLILRKFKDKSALTMIKRQRVHLGGLPKHPQIKINSSKP